MSDSTSSPVIRDGTLADAPVIVEFNRCLALETEGKVLNEAVLFSGVSRALADPERLRYWVAELGSPATLVGQAAITREWSDWRDGWIWWLQSVYVAQPYRGCGVFRALYHHIQKKARGNPEVIGLRLYVEESNQPAQLTYQALGMKPGGYSVFELLWIERSAKRDPSAVVRGLLDRVDGCELPPSVQEPGCRARVDGRRGLGRSLAQCSLSGHPESCGSVGQNIVTHWPSLSRERPPQLLRAFLRAQDLDRRHAVSIQPKVVGMPDLSPHPARLDCPDLGWSIKRHFVQSITSGHNDCPVNVFLPGQDLRDKFRLVLVGNSHELVGGTAWVAERPDQVEDCAERQLTSHGREPDQARVERGGKQKGDSQLGQATARLERIEMRRDAQDAEHVGAAGGPGRRSVAVLDNRHAAGRHDNRRRRRDVNSGRAVTPCPASINQGIAFHPAFPGYHAFTDRGDGPLELNGGLALDSQSRQECGRDDVRGLAIEQRRKRRAACRD